MASLLRDRITAAPVPAGPDPIGYAGPLLALALGACAMGASPIFVRLVSPEVGPFASAFWRVALALPALGVWMRWEAARLSPASPARPPRPGAPPSSYGGGEGAARRRSNRLSYVAGAAFAGDLVFWHLSIVHTTIANATFLATMAPVFVVLGTLALGGRVAGLTYAGLALCLAGGVALVGQSAAFAPGRLDGDLFGIVTAVFFGAYLMILARARAGVGPGAISFRSSLATAPILLAVALVFDADRLWPQTAGAWTALLALALVSQVAGQGLLALALGRLPAVFSSLVIFIEAIFAAAAGWVVLGEALSPIQAAGGALILLGIWIARPRPRVTFVS